MYYDEEGDLYVNPNTESSFPKSKVMKILKDTFDNEIRNLDENEKRVFSLIMDERHLKPFLAEVCSEYFLSFLNRYSAEVSFSLWLRFTEKSIGLFETDYIINRRYKGSFYFRLLYSSNIEDGLRMVTTLGYDFRDESFFRIVDMSWTAVHNLCDYDMRIRQIVLAAFYQGFNPFIFYNLPNKPLIENKACKLYVNHMSLFSLIQIKLKYDA